MKELPLEHKINIENQFWNENEGEERNWFELKVHKGCLG